MLKPMKTSQFYITTVFLKLYCINRGPRWPDGSMLLDFQYNLLIIKINLVLDVKKHRDLTCMFTINSEVWE